MYAAAARTVRWEYSLGLGINKESTGKQASQVCSALLATPRTASSFLHRATGMHGKHDGGTETSTNSMFALRPPAVVVWYLFGWSMLIAMSQLSFVYGVQTCQISCIHYSSPIHDWTTSDSVSWGDLIVEFDR